MQNEERRPNPNTAPRADEDTPNEDREEGTFEPGTAMEYGPQGDAADAGEDEQEAEEVEKEKGRS